MTPFMDSNPVDTMHHRDNDLMSALERTIEANLVKGRTRVGDSARELEISTRTLQRRLWRERLTYSSVVDKVRYRVAVRWLRDTDLSMTTMAKRLGYAGISGFTRAFTRWAGVAPSRYRKNRDPKVVERFLEKQGLKKVPKGKEVDHKVPLEDGGSDTVRNLQLLTTKRHADKTAREATARARKKARAKKKK